MNTKANIIWIVVDCVRNYKSGLDDRDKLDSMIDLETEFVSFNNMMVSAPSSIMSAVNFLTGIPSYYLAGNYSQFQFDRSNYWSINDILKHYGYRNYSVLNARECRTMLTDLLDPVDKKYHTKAVRPTMMRWPNREVTDTFLNLLDAKPADPAFHFLWYNTRLDPNMSDEIHRLVGELKERRLYDDSIVILTADHGYPDRSRGLVSDGWDLWKAGLRHDIILTNDNINVPFLIKYPGSVPKSVETLVSTEDIVPTILDILGLEVPYKKKLEFFGSSLLPLIAGEDVEFFANRIIRSDARFALQKNRNTSLQRRNMHLIVRHHDLEVELYDTSEDPGEVHNVADDPKYSEEKQELLNYFLGENQRILALQKEAAAQKLRSSFKSLRLSGRSAYVMVYNDSYLYQTVVECLKTLLPDLEIHLVVISETAPRGCEVNEFLTSVIVADDVQNQQTPKTMDFAFEVVDDPVASEFRENYEFFKRYRGKNRHRISWNGDVDLVNNWLWNSPNSVHYRSIAKKIWDRVKLGVHEPKYFWDELVRVSKKIKKKG